MADTRVNQTTNGDQVTFRTIGGITRPQRTVAIDTDGNFVVTWVSSDQDGSLQGVYYQRYDSDGVAQTANDIAVNIHTTGSQQFANVAMARSTGDFVITWTSNNQDGSGYGIYAQRYNAAGVAQSGTDVLINTITTGAQQYSTVAMDADGDFVITWTGQNPSTGNTDIYYRRFSNTGVDLDATEQIVNVGATDLNQENSVVAMDNAGNFVVAWMSNDGSNNGIFARRYDAGSATWSSIIPVNTHTTNEQSEPSIAIDPDSGEFVITWTSLNQDGSGRGIYGQRFDASGGTQGAEFRVNTRTNSDQVFSNVSADESGGFVVTWASNVQTPGDTSAWGISGQRYDASGNALGTEFRINTYTTGSQQGPSVAVDSSGDFVVAWSSTSSTAPQDGDSSGVFFRQFGSIAITPVGTTNTSEAGGSATFNVVLNSQPTADVTINLVSSDTTEGTVSVPSLTFTSVNWNVVQQFTVNGVDDQIDDGNQTYTIQTSITTTDDVFSAIDPADVVLTNIDNDAAGVTVTPISLNTTEAGGTASFTIQLQSEPTNNVTINLTSSDPTEGSVQASVLFTPLNWNTAQTVTVTGLDDAIADGDQTYNILTEIISLDTTYDAIDPADVTGLVNADNDTAGYTLTPISGNTTEGGSTAAFTIRLNSEPTADVTINLTSSNTTEGTVAPASITFNNTNWNTAQTVTVTGVNDNIDDGDQAYTIQTTVTTTDLAYTALDPADVNVTNIDDDTAGYTISAISGNTTESGGTATFTIRLNSQPTADVTIDLSSSDPGEGTVAPTSVTFNSTNWNADQTVTVTGVDDALIDGNQAYSIITTVNTTDSVYTLLDPGDVSVTNTDDDTPGFIVSAISGSTTEAGGTATFTIRLTTQPTSSVTVNLSSSDLGEGSVTPTSVTFDGTNWNTAQTVTVTGADDALVDGSQTFTIITATATSADANYNGLNPGDVTVTNTDDDVAGFTISPISGNTTEAGGTATFTIRLNSQPINPVTVNFSSSDTTEGTVNTTSVVFNNTNWNVDQTVTITGVDDVLIDGNQNYTIETTLTTTDPGYTGLNPADVNLTNTDNDTAGYVIGAISGNTTEDGGTATFTIRLTTQPTADVTVNFSSSDLGEGTVAPASVTFNASNWNLDQTVTVTGVDDNQIDGNQSFTIATSVTTTDADYAATNPDDVTVTNTDNDIASYIISAASGNTSEDGGTATFTIRLSSQPTADVTINLSSSDPDEGTVTTPSVTFTTANWNVDQIVTVTGADDVLVDGNQTFDVVTAPAVSTDLNYNGTNPADVTFTNVDNDTPGFVIGTISGSTTEAGGTATFTIRLVTQPIADVTINFSSSDTTEGTVLPASYTFNATNWNIAQTVTVTGVNDFVVDGSQTFDVITTVTTTDPNYNGLNPDDVTVTNTDDDVAGFTVSTISGDTTEAGGTATFTIRLNSQPIAPVTINISSSDTTEGTVPATPLTFNSTNWNVDQTVTVTGVDDAIADGDEPYTLITTATSTDPNYTGLNPDDVAVTNIDNDIPGYTISAISGNTTEAGGTATFTIQLNTQPVNPVTINFNSSDIGEGTVLPASYTFTSADWNMAQTVTVTGVEDAFVDGNQTYDIITTVNTLDVVYGGLNPNDVTVVNTDNDTAGFQISPISGDTTEAGGTATFTVQLTSQPSADVTINLSSSDVGEGTVGTPSLTFTSANWNTAQTVTVTGVEDAIADGNQTYSIVTGTATSADGNYNGINPADVTVINTDNDIAGFVVSPISGNTNEGGGTATFTVRLTSQPTAPVTVNLTSSDLTEGSVAPASITFDDTNWNLDQTVTVTGVEDALVDGNQTFTIQTSVTTTDTVYSTLDPADVTVTNTDNDSPGFVISPISGNTTEGGGTATFTLRLTTQPLNPVTINFTSSDTTEGTVSPTSIVFTAANWNTNQTVTITGVEDVSLDGDQNYTISSTVTTTDVDYNGLTIANIAITNLDNDVNLPPVVSSAIADQTATEDLPFSFVLPLATTFTDPNPEETLSYNVQLAGGGALPTWLTYNEITRTFSGTPENDDVGTVDIDVTATDTASQSITDTFRITINNANDPPTLDIPIADQTANEGTLFTLDLPDNTFNDIDVGDVLTYTATLTSGGALPSWLSFNPTTLTFSGTPTSTDVETLQIRLRATDLSGASANDTFTLTVTGINDPPIVTNPIPDRIANEDSFFFYAFPTNTFFDSDPGDSLTYTASLAGGGALPSWLTFDPAARAFVGTPLNENVGSLSIQVTATDNASSSVSDIFNLQVINTNDEPVLAIALTNQTATENAAFTYAVPAGSFTDPDVGDSLNYNATLSDGAPLPSWLSFDPATQTFSGTPANGDVGSITVRVTVNDDFNETASGTFTLTVNDINTPPSLVTPLPNRAATENVAFTFTVPSGTFTDPDLGDTLTYSATLDNGNPLPTWLNFNSTTRTFSGTPDNPDVGTIDVRVTVTDNGSETASDVFALTVANVNDAPVLSNPITNQSVTEGSAFNLILPANTFTEIDQGDSIASYTATLSNGNSLPTWLNFNALTQTFSGTPGSMDVGSLTIRVRATDTFSASTDATFTLTVNDLNTAPIVLNPLSDRNATEGNPFNFTVPTNTFSDPDAGDVLTYTATLAGGGALPSWLNFNSSTRQFTGTPGDFDVGAIALRVTATDTALNSTFSDFNLTVANVNDAPRLITPIPDQMTQEGNLFSFAIPAGSFIDVDPGDVLTYTADLSTGAALPSWLNFDSLTQTFSGTPTAADVGNLNVRVRVTDLLGTSATDFFTIMVQNPNDPPVLNGAIANQTATEDSAFTFTLPAGTFTDPDPADVLSYSATLVGGGALPSWLSFNPTTRTFSGTPRNANVGDITVRVVATDPAIQTAEGTFTLTVNNTNDAPTLATPIPDRITVAGNPFNLSVAGNFSEIDPGDSLSYSARLSGGQPLPTWIAFDGVTGTFTANPTEANLGLFSLQVTATDQSSVSVSDTFTLRVDSALVNVPPVVANPIPDQTATENSPFSFTVAANAFTDGNGDPLTYAARLSSGSLLPAWLSFDPVTRTFSGTPGSNNAGTLSIRVTATEPALNTVSDVFDLVVLGINEPPVVTPSRASFTYSTSQGFIQIDNGLAVSDMDDVNLESATVTIDGFVSGEDSLQFVNQNGITGAIAAGVLTLTGTASIAQYQAALRSVRYSNTGTSTTPRTIRFTVNDGEATSNAGAVQINFTGSGSGPFIDLNGTDAGINFSTSGTAGQAIAITDSDLSITNSTGTIVSALIVISNPIEWTNEQLFADTTGTPITATYKPDAGTLTLQGTATTAQYEQVLRTITYRNNAIDPNAAIRKIVFIANDGINNSVTAETTLTLTTNGNGGGPTPTLVTTPLTDSIFAPGSNNTVQSILSYLQQSDQIDGGSGIDTFLLMDGSGNATVDANNGSSQINGVVPVGTRIRNFERFDFSGFQGNATMNGSNALDDWLVGGSGDDRLFGFAANDTLIGNAGNDLLDGGTGIDTMEGGSGDDRYFVDNVSDRVVENFNSGFDTVVASFDFTLSDHVENLELTEFAGTGIGNALNNTITGTDLRNRLVGELGNDTLIGGGDRDVLIGGGSRDILIGGAGIDRLTGGQGRDKFVLTSTRRSDRDRIRDFTRRDDIQISRSGFGTNLRLGSLRNGQFVLGSQATDRNDRFIYDAGRGNLYFDADGAGGRNQRLIATLSGRPGLRAGDIEIIA